MTFEVEHYDVELDLLPVAPGRATRLFGGEIRVVAKLALRNRGSLPIDRLCLDLYRLLQVDDVEAHGTPCEWTQDVESLSQRHQVNVLRIHLPESAEPGQAVSVQVSYSGPICGAPEVYAYVWDHVAPEFSLLRWELKWFPWIHDLRLPETDFGYDLTVRNPETMVVVSEGIRTELPTQPGLSRVRFTCPRRQKYRFTVAGAPFSIRKISDGVTLYLLGDESPVPVIQEVLSLTESACRSWFGQVPDQPFSIVEIPEGYGSESSIGLVLQTADGFGRGLDHQQALRQAIHAFGHEVIHRWHPRPAALDRTRLMDEGLTHYLEACLLGQVLGQDAFHDRMARYRSSFLANHVSETIASCGESVDATSRGKGPWAFAVLHEILGERFESVLRDYSAAFSGQDATWQDFVTVVEKATPGNGSKWRDSWIESTASTSWISEEESIPNLARLTLDWNG